MKLTRLQITIEPWHLQNSVKELKVEAIVDGMTNTITVPFEDDDFESRFEYLMEYAMREIKKLVKIQEKGQ